MVDTARPTADLQTLFADNTSGAISPQDARDMLVSFGTGCRDVAAGKTPTFSSAPNGTYPGNASVNGVSAAGSLLTFPDDGSTGWGGSVTLGWRAVDISGSTLTATLDYGASVVAEVVAAVVTGEIETGQQIYHPAAVKVEYSSDNSAYSTFGTALTSLNDDPIAIGPFVCVFTASPIARRYWRLSVDEPSPGTGDNWIMLRRLRLFGRLI